MMIQFNHGVAVLGLGYIGLPTSTALALHGVRVKGVDINPATVEAINSGRAPIVEPDLDVAVADAVSSGLLTAATEVPEADVFMIAVPTPFQDDHMPDLAYVEAAARAIGPKLRGGEIVILESTSPPGTTRKVSEWLAEERPDLTFPHVVGEGAAVQVAHCPERVLPGRIMIELIENDRIVGGLSRHCAERAAELYRVFCKGDVALTTADAAEMAKLAENSFRDVNIAFANELAAVCGSLDLDVWEVIRLANRHPRVDILKPGPGVGGHCIAVDPWFIVSAAPEEARLIRSAREINDARPQAVARATVRSSAVDATIAALGLAFKANIDDLRESPAVEVVKLIAQALPAAHILAAEPHVEQLPADLAALNNVTLTPWRDALAAADTVLLLVDHDAFNSIVVHDLSGKSVVDTRGVLGAQTRVAHTPEGTP